MTSETETTQNRFVQSIDLTSRTREKKSTDEFKEPDPPLDEMHADDLPDQVEQVFRVSGWKELMPVQRKSIPYVLDKRDLIVQSRTGSGKTGAFLLPLFELLDPSRKEQQALVLTPTRELARQVHEEFERLKVATPGTNELESVLIYGGVGYGPQIEALKNGAQLVVGTPGRTLDHLKKKNLIAKTLDMFILDEADEMLSMGFLPDIKTIMGFLPQNRRSYLFSATMPGKIRTLANDLMRDPGFLSLSSGHVSVDAIDYHYCLVKQMDKDRVLVQLIEAEAPQQSLIFANTKRDVRYLTQFLQNRGYSADEISGDLSQRDREKAMGRLRDGSLRFLVATDVAARGIDITDLDYVFMYDVPQDKEYFIHRSGRTARAGKKGTAIVLATHEDEYQLTRTAGRYGIDIARYELDADEPEEEEVDIEAQATEVLAERLNLQRSRVTEHMERFVPLVKELASENPALLAQLVEEVYQNEYGVEEADGKAAARRNGA